MNKTPPIWEPSSWRTREIKQHPTYQDKNLLSKIEDKIKKSAPLVLSEEIKELREKLSLVYSGKAFLLQGGDCAESFADFSTGVVRNNLRVLLQMALILSYSKSMPIVKVARIAGQFAKPRSSNTEIRDNLELPSYRGDIINGIEFTSDSRKNDPNRMLQAYHQSVETINSIRSHMSSGFGSMRRVHDWNLSFVEEHISKNYKDMCGDINKAFGFISACGASIDEKEFNQTNIYTSHEALLLNYEESLVRKNTGSLKEKYVAASAHMLWVGDRTKAVDGAHIEFLRGVANPVGIKVGPSTDVGDLLTIINKINPDNEAGKIVLIVRMGADKINKYFLDIAQKVKESNMKVIWSSDPMHGNTRVTDAGYKTREFSEIIKELQGFFSICKKVGIYGGGVHLEMTGDDVTECVGGDYNKIDEQNLSERYHTACDPRLNATQSIELSFLLADIIDCKPCSYLL